VYSVRHHLLVLTITLTMCLTVSGRVTLCADQRYGQYIDRKTGVVKAPKGFAKNDDCWRTSWFYGSLLVIHAKDPALYKRLKEMHGVDVASIRTFLTYFRDHCLDDKGWKRPTTLTSDFSRDQLVPLLYLLACVKAYGPAECQPLAKTILSHLVEMVKKRGAISAKEHGKIGRNLQYVIDVLSGKYEVPFLDGTERGFCKHHFSLALKAHNAQAQLPGDLATEGDYSVFNTLSLVTVQCIMWGKKDDDVKTWRRNYRIHADKGWGPAFRIVSGRTVRTHDIDAYCNAHITREQDNDIVLSQRPHKFLSGDFPKPQFRQIGKEGEWLVLDFVILRGLQLTWQ
jgi:hypothetical protein